MKAAGEEIRNPSKNAARIAEMGTRLRVVLDPVVLEIVDESHLHAGHAGARDGRGHFALRIVSEAFTGQGSLARHRAVYAALGELLTTDIHALTIAAVSPRDKVV